MDERLGVDLDLGLREEERTVRAGPGTAFDLEARRREGVHPAAADLGTVRARANLAQALIVRLMTERGELAPLGHPRYGSRHHELIGRPNNETNRNLLKLHILECLSEEPRIRIASLDVRPGAGPGGRHHVRVEARLTVEGDPDPFDLVVPFSFAEAVR